MIRSKKDYLAYLEADRKAFYTKSVKPRLFGDEIWKFQRTLRKLEYYRNCKKSPLDKLYALFLRFRYHHQSIRLGFTIPCNVFGPGLSIAHYGYIIINGNVRIGANCRIHSGVTIGGREGEKYPVIGNNVYIGPGAVIYGSVVIADNIAIGANAVVNKSFLEPGITLGGVPAIKISNKGSEDMLKKKTEDRVVYEKSN